MTTIEARKSRLLAFAGQVAKFGAVGLVGFAVDVTVRQTWLQSLFGSGDVLINSGLEHPLVLQDVPNADLVQQVLHDLMEESSTVIGSRRQEQSALADQPASWGRH